MKILKFRNLLMMAIDLGLVYYSYIIASILIHNFGFDFEELNFIVISLIWLLPLYMINFIWFNLYAFIWEYTSISELYHVILAMISAFLFTQMMTLLFELPFTTSLLVIAHLVLFLSLMGVRLSYRIYKNMSLFFSHHPKTIRTLVIGAGSAGSLLIKELQQNKLVLNKVICIVDDDLRKTGKAICGVKVVGTTQQLLYLIFKYRINEIIVAIPSANKQQYQKILRQCEKYNVKVKVFPPFYQLVDKSFSLDKIREVEVDDLIGRDEIKIDDKGINDFLHQETIFVSGGGGSIGSEICRQIINYEPKKIIIFDQYENNAYDIQNELIRIKDKFNYDVEILVLIGSIQDESRLNEIFAKYPISIVFHAAAHKHVPLMEDCPKEAIKNNVFGTYLIAKMSHENHVNKFVLISSDKAVNPTNIMGATKRLSEMIINAFNKMSKTQFAAVRFGNVLGSNGSVVPLFKKQIKEGGPVTVTHKEVIRYFMTIREAVSLVLQAGAYTHGGEIFVLDMGEPVKILKLAENLIRLSGYEPYKDIDISFTGLRPGDKLYEELMTDDERLEKTSNDLISVLKQQDVRLDMIEEYLTELRYALSVKSIDVKKIFSKFIPTYKQVGEGSL